MADENKELENGAGSETDSGNAGVSERSEREIEAGATGELESLEEEAKEVEAALDVLAEADPKKAVVGLKKRLAKLTAQRNTARAAVAERDALKTRVATYEQRERDAEKAIKEARRRTPEGQKAEERRQAVRETLDEAFGPGYSDYQAKAAQLQQEADDRANEAYTRDGLSYLRSELEDHGIKADDKTLLRWERAVGSELAEDKALKAQYQRPTSQADAVKEAVNRVRDGLVNPAVKLGGGKPIERIARNREAVLGGGRDRSAVGGIPEPEVDFTPPKGLTREQAYAYWDKVKEDWRNAHANDE